VYYLGICYERGLGTECNEAKAAEMYRRAASVGHVSAMYNLAVFFENGTGGMLHCNTHYTLRMFTINRLTETFTVNRWVK